MTCISSVMTTIIIINDLACIGLVCFECSRMERCEMNGRYCSDFLCIYTMLKERNEEAFRLSSSALARSQSCMSKDGRVSLTAMNVILFVWRKEKKLI
jgi:hypothetical protein